MDPLVSCRPRFYSRVTVPDTDVLSAFPHTLHASTTQPERLYRRQPELFAIHARIEPPPGWPVVLTLDDPPIVICRGNARALPRTLLDATLTPVYALTPRGAPAVPTGLVLVRFREGIDAAACGDVVAREGFTIHDILPYAPSAAWVRAASGGIPASLRGIPALESLPDVVNVEPQMVRRSARR
jgi:hypothetical protein